MRLGQAGLRQYFSTFLLPAILVGSGLEVFPYCAQAQETPSAEIEGYITSVKVPDGFDVNGEHVKTRPETTYGVLGNKNKGDAHASPDAVRVGAFVHVAGATDKASRSVEATSVLFRDDWDKKLSGFGVIDKVIAAGAEPIFQADGYRIRITHETDLTFDGELNSFADVKTNTWVRYRGRRGADGVLVAAEAKFVSATTGLRALLSPVRPVVKQQIVPGSGALLDASGNLVKLGTKVRLSQAGGWCGWHRVSADEALQTRILRVGTSLAPAFQKQLPDGDSSKISFRFYVVEEDKIRSDLDCNVGLILIPKQVAERLSNDDQLAALLADGIAFNLQRQSAVVSMSGDMYFSAVEAAEIATGLPGLLAAGVGGGVLSHELEVRLEEQRGRVALALMADAGYDPRQPPEAWRLLAPKNLPKDLSSIKYPSRSGYQLGILNLQYEDGKSRDTSSASLAGTF